MTEENQNLSQINPINMQNPQHFINDFTNLYNMHKPYMDTRNSDIIPEIIDGLDDSINMGISNPSEETSGK